MPATGAAPLVVGFDTARTTAGTIAEHLLLVGNGDAIALASAAQMTNYNYTLPGFYLAQTWLRDDSGIALSPSVPISVTRTSDGAVPPTATVSVQATTDPLTFAFGNTVTPSGDDPIVAELWDFGDGTTDGSGGSMPFRTYVTPGVYQPVLLATTRAGIPLYARTVVVVRDGNGAVPPSLLLTASPEDTSPETPVTVTAYIEGVTPDSKVTGAEVDWPDLVDASPTVTPTASGITVTSQHALATAGSFDVPVRVQLANLPALLTATARVTVANIDGSAPSPVLLHAPAAVALAGEGYSSGTDANTLLVAGAGPFTFGAAAPSPSNFRIDSEGHITWQPTHDQVGLQRLAVRIVDTQGSEATVSWVVQVFAPSRGCALAGGSATSGALWPLALLLAALAWRRRRLSA